MGAFTVPGWPPSQESLAREAIADKRFELVETKELDAPGGIKVTRIHFQAKIPNTTMVLHFAVYVVPGKTSTAGLLYSDLGDRFEASLPDFDRSALATKGMHQPLISPSQLGAIFKWKGTYVLLFIVLGAVEQVMTTLKKKPIAAV
jgi:hypothetical protein